MRRFRSLPDSDPKDVSGEYTEARRSDEEILFAPETGISEEPEEKKISFLTTRQKLLSLAAAAVSFIVFFIIFFPYENAIRSFLQSGRSGVKIQYSSLSHGFFRETRVRNASVSAAGGLKITAQEAILNPGWTGLLTGTLKGGFFFDNFRLQTDQAGIDAKALEIQTDLKNYLQGPEKYEGIIAVSAHKAEFLALPPGIALPLNPSDLKIDRMQIRLKLASGSYSVDNSSVQSNLFTVTIQAGGKLARDFTESQLAGTLCLKPVSDLEARNPSVYSMYTMLGGGVVRPEVCFALGGTVGAPSANPLSH